MVLNPTEVQSELSHCKGWTTNPKGEITRSFKFPGFARAMLFANAVGLLAETADHHPDILIQYNQVTLSLSTHSAGGLTRKDFDLASRINELPAS